MLQIKLLIITISGGIQLGLGDFIFYGILITLTCQSELTMTLACILSIVYVSIYLLLLFIME